MPLETGFQSRTPSVPLATAAPRNRAGLRLAAFAGLAIAGALPALAQSASGTMFVNVSCKQGLTHDFGVPDSSTISLGSTCFDQFGHGTVASVNSSSAAWAVGNGGVFFDQDSSSNFVFFGDNQGGADVVTNFNMFAGDLTFTNIANPDQGGVINIGGMHYIYAGHVETRGVSNCSLENPRAGIFFQFSFGPCADFGGYLLDRSQAGGSLIQQAMIGYPNDGSTVHAFCPGGATSLASPYTFFLHVSNTTSVLYCDGLPTGFGDAHAMLRWSFPCGSPAFDLPPGYTVNSAQLGIVNNIHVGASISQQPADTTTCRATPAAMSVVVAGGPVTCQWQWRPIGTTGWFDIVEGANTDPGTSEPVFTAAGSRTASIQTTFTGSGADLSRWEQRCIIGAPCGELETSAASVSVCLADVNCDFIVDLGDFFQFLNDFDQTLPGADVNADQSVDLGDFFAFLNAFDLSC